jgi:23S rRNA (guanosine2251-2'-O)-methyltransferase
MRELIYGRNAVYECLRAKRRDVFKLILSVGTQEKGTLAQSIQIAKERRIAVQRVPRAQIDKISDGHQGVAAEVSGYPYVTLDDILQLCHSERREESLARKAATLRLAQGNNLQPLLLVLDCIQDPQNLGTLLRTAEAVGVNGVIIAEDRAASITPAVVNASSGATEHLRVARVTNITRALERLKESDIWVVGLDASCAPGGQNYATVDLRGPLAIVVGSEGQGIRRLVRETCDLLVKLPMLGAVTSLNAAVAGSVVLYETLRQRKENVS